MSRYHYVRHIQHPTYEMLEPIIHAAFEASHQRFDFTKADFEAMDRKGAIWLGAYDRDVLIGCVAMTEVSPVRARLHKLAVLPEKRGTGLGSYLVLHAEREVFAGGVRRMELVCLSDDTGLVDFYKRQGYELVKEKQHRKTEQQIAFMEKRMPHLVDQVGSRVHAYELPMQGSFQMHEQSQSESQQQQSVEIVLVYHPDEIDKPSNTGHVIQRCLPEITKEIIWHRNTIASHLEGMGNDHETVLLYPSEDAVPLDVYAAKYKDLGKPLRLIVLDGTWQQAQKMMVQSPSIRALPAVKLVNLPKSQYALRRNQKPMGLCTLESVGEALAEMSYEAGRDHLMKGFREWLEIGYVKYKRK